MQEKNYCENTAKWMAQHLEALLDYMQYGHAVIAFYKQNGKFKFVKATLRYYEAEFHKKYNPANVEAAVVYWDIDEHPVCKNKLILPCCRTKIHTSMRKYIVFVRNNFKTCWRIKITIVRIVHYQIQSVSVTANGLIFFPIGQVKQFVVIFMGNTPNRSLVGV